MNEEKKQALISVAEQLIKHAEQARDEIPFGLSDDVEGELALIKIALSSLRFKSIKLPKIKHPAQFDYADKVIEVLTARGLTVEGGDDD